MGIYTKQEEIINTIRVLRGEVEILTERVKEHATGHIITAIGVINGRIEELIEEVTAPYFKDEDGDIGRLPGQTRSSHLRSVEDAIAARQYIEENEAEEEEALSILAEQSRQAKQEEDVYDGYKEHTEAMEQARLREIQDKAAGRKPNAVRDAYLHSSKVKPMEGENLKDDYEHTDEYYDTERNRAPSIQTMTSDGLSNRTMKQKYGQAVMTVSEMMQDELEPLPINTFE